MSTTNLLTRLFRDEHGATAVEYGLILAMIVLAMMAALNGVANETINMWSDVRTASQDAIG
jgi:pilus assembly protein Flp/PilA